MNFYLLGSYVLCVNVKSMLSLAEICHSTQHVINRIIVIAGQ